MKYRIEYKHTKKDFDEIFKIEQEYLEPSTISSVEQVIEWDNKNSDIHIFVRDTEKDKIVGEITLLPLSKFQFDRFIKNKLQDTEINKDTLLDYIPNQSYYLLFSAIAIDSKYRNDRLVLSLLLEGLYRKILDLLNRGIKFLNMCAEGQTEDWMKFIENFLNLSHKYTTENGYKLYSFNNIDEFYTWLRVFPEYIASYDKKYKIIKK